MLNVVMLSAVMLKVVGPDVTAVVEGIWMKKISTKVQSYKTFSGANYADFLRKFADIRREFADFRRKFADFRRNLSKK
jgi:hypothetical protein